MRNLFDLLAQFGIKSGQLLVDGLRLFLARLQLFGCRAQLFVHRLQLFVGGFQFFVGGFVLLYGEAQALARVLQLIFKLPYDGGKTVRLALGHALFFGLYLLLGRTLSLLLEDYQHEAGHPGRIEQAHSNTHVRLFAFELDEYLACLAVALRRSEQQRAQLRL